MPNRLAAEKSPYLLQHARNPVDWWPWCDQAFQAARRLDRPVFLSVGYAACHWCHVMERESFEDLEVAEALNRAFVCIKVDREERPDLDAVYMAACQLLTGRGGWPLTVVMTPDKRPFFAATYLPRRGVLGKAGLLDMVERISAYWRSDRAMVQDSAEQIADQMQKALAPCPGPRSGPDLGPKILDQAVEQFQERFDPLHGGFGPAPKFPSPHVALFLLGRPGGRDMAMTTLRAMRQGGLWDHLGFGFHRYAQDERWIVPHFEKMLSDQALAAMAFLEAHRAMAEPPGQGDLAATAGDIFTYVLGDLAAPEGAFCCAEDADTQGREGGFYLWTCSELDQVLGPDEGRFWARAFGFQDQGNARDKATGQNVIHLPRPLEPDAAGRFPAVRERLLQARARRPRPLLDDKVLADWNGLMIAALAMGGAILGRPDLTAAAARAADFVLFRLAGGQGRLLHRWRDGQAAVPGMADDYAFMIWGLLELCAASKDKGRLDQAARLQQTMDEVLWDEERGGYFLAPDSGEGLPARPKDAYDGAAPSANSAALSNLVRLSRATGETAWEDRARRLVRAFAGQIRETPTGHAHLLSGLDLLLHPESGPAQGIHSRGRLC